MADLLRRLTSSGELRAPLKEPVQLEFPQLEETVSGLARELWRDGFFVEAPRLKPPGTRVRFVLTLGGPGNELSGRGVVTRAHREDKERELHAGMQIRFMDLDRATRKTIQRWLDTHGRQAKVETPEEAVPEDDEELQAGVAALRMILGQDGEAGSGLPVEVELDRTKAALSELRQRSEALTGELRRRLDQAGFRLAELEEANGAQQRRLEETAAGCSAAESRAEDLDRQRARLASELQQARVEQARTEKSLAAAGDESSAQAQRIAELESSLAGAESSWRKSVERLKRVTESHAALKKEHGTLTARNRVLEEELEAANSASLGLQKQAAERQGVFRGRLESLEAGVATAEEARAQLVQRLEEAAEQRIQLGAQLDSVRAQAERARKQLDSAQASLETRGERIRQLESSLMEAESGARASADSLQRLAGERDALELERTKLRSRSARLEEQLRAGREELHTQQKSAGETEADLRARLELLEAGLATAERARAELGGRVEESATARAAAEQRLAESAAAHAETERRVAEQGARIKKLEAQLKTADAEARRLEKALEEATRTDGRRQRQIESLQGELDRAAGERQRLELVFEERLSGLQQELTAAARNGLYLTERIDEIHAAQNVDKQQLLEAVAGRGEFEAALEETGKQAARLEEALRAAHEATRRETARRGELESSLATAEAESRETAECLQAMALERDALLEKRHSEAAERERLATELAGERQKADAAHRQADETESSLRQALERLEEKLAAAGETRAGLERRLAAEAEAVAGAERRAAQLEARDQHLASELEGAEATARRLDEEQDAMRTILGQRDGCIAELEAELESSRTALGLHDGRIAELEMELETATTDLDQRDGRIVELETEAGAARSRLEQAEQSGAELRQSLERQTAESRAELAKLGSALEEQRQKLEEQAALRQQAEKAESALRGELEGLRRELEEARGLEEQLAAARSETARLGPQLQSAHEELDRLAAAAAAPEGPSESPSRRPRRRGWALWLTAVLVTALAVTWMLANDDDGPPARPAPAPSGISSPAAETGPAPASALEPEAPTAPDAGLEPVAAEGPTEADTVRQEILDTLEAWAGAWSGQRAEDYLAFYSPEFRSTRGRSFEAWAGLRRQRILGPGYIRVELDRIEVEPAGPDSATASFVQSYTSDGFSDRVAKRLELARAEDGWRIVAEEAAQ
jgi:chromosome segregation ATPase